MNRKRIAVLDNYFFLIIFFLFIVLALFFFLRASKHTAYDRAGKSVQAVLNFSHQSVKDIWLKGHFDRLRIWTSNPAIVTCSSELMHSPGKKEMEPVATYQKLQTILMSLAAPEKEVQEVLLVSPELKMLASTSGHADGQLFISDYGRERLGQALLGKNMLIPPFICEDSTASASIPASACMYTCGPVTDSVGRVLAILVVRYNSGDFFSSIVQAGYSGTTGETYMINARGKMLSESRFNRELVEAGLLNEGQQSMLTLEVRDPGHEPGKFDNFSTSRSAMPYTYAAGQLLKKKSGHSIIAYRDYRGIPVVGAWLWDEEIGAGFISEIDEHEVLHQYRDTLRLAIALVIAAVFFSIIIFVILKNVTRKLTHNLEQSEKQFRTLVENIPGVVYRCETEYPWRMTFISDEIKNMLGYSASDFMGDPPFRTIGEIILPEHRSENRQRTREAIDHHKSFIHQYKVKDSQGQVHWLSSTGKALYNPDDRPEFIDGTLYDITDQKRIEEQLLEERRRLMMLLDESPIGTVISVDGVVSFKNPQIEKLLGVTEGQNVLQTYARPAEREELMNILNEFGVARNIETQLKGRNGAVLDVLLTLYKTHYQNREAIMGWVIDITKQKKAEQEASVLNNIVYNALDAANVGAWWIDFKEEDTFYALNPSLLEWVRTSDNKYRLSDWFQLLEAAAVRGPDFKRATDDAIEQFSGVIHGKWTSCNATYPAILRSGRLVWTIARAIVTERDSNGKPLFMVGTMIDVTEQHEDEQKLSLLNQLVYKSLESADVGAWWVDFTEEDFFHALDPVAVMLEMDITPDKKYRISKWVESLQQTGKHSTEFQQMIEYAIQQFSGTISGEVPFYKVIYPAVFDDGRVKWIMARGDITKRDEQGNALVMVGTLIEITEQYEAERQLSLLNQLVHNSLESAHVGAWWIDFSEEDTWHALEPAMRMLDMDINEDRCYRISDWANRMAASAVENAELRSIIDEAFERFAGSVSGKYPHHKAIYPVVLPDGSRRWILARGDVTKRDKDGAAQLMVGTLIEITEQYETERQLAATQEEAIRATQAKSEFLARMSHEIRTPMNAIIGMTHLTLQTELTTKQRDNLGKVHNAALSLLEIVNEILDFSKIEAGRLQLENVPFDLEQVLEELASIVTYKAHEKGLEVVFDLHPSLPSYLVGDPLRLKQILINLANNAVKFTEKGEVVISVEQIGGFEGNINLSFSVRDTGIGLTQPEMANLFQSFSQADSSTTRKYGGTGLGLSISKSLVKMMDGDIGVKSEKGKGSTFYFTGWFTLDGMQKERNLDPPADLRGMKVLVCDDNETSLDVIKEVLTGFSFRVTAVKSGRRAIDEIEKNKPDPFQLVVMDWNMPEMDGIETVNRIKHATATATESDPVFIMLTAHNRKDVLLGAEQAGITATLIKPVSYSTLFDTIMTACGHENLRPAVPERNRVLDDLMSSLQNIRVLLVEDNPINQDVATGIMEQCGIVIDIAGNGEEGLAKVRQSGSPSVYDVVLMDIQMPVMDGYEATREIRKLGQYDNLPVIAMTADAVTGVRERCMAAGMNDYVTKPVNPKELYACLVKWTRDKATALPRNQGTHTVSNDIATVFPEIPGVDSGAYKLRFDDKTYLKFLQNFEKHFAFFVQDLRLSLQNKNREKSQRMAHDLKGLSGTLDATALHTFAIALDDKMKNEQHFDFDTDLTTLNALLNPILDTIRLFLATIPGKQATQQHTEGTLNLALLVSALNELKELLHGSDMEAGKKIKDLQAIPGTDTFEVHFTDIEELISTYDFDAALVKVDDMIRTIAN